MAKLKSITWARAAEQVKGHNLSYRSAFSTENISDYFNTRIAKRTSDNATTLNCKIQRGLGDSSKHLIVAL